MRAFDNGCFFTVQCGSTDTEAFASRWPCSGIRYGDCLSFQFDKRNGDLVDLRYSNGGREANQERIDRGALEALSEDAKKYGYTRLNLKIT